ncbi:MAG: NADH-quinone oxidoreductase subunit NuoH [Nitrososphaerota archaeon]|nr:NADH-quinone oxidoreductase subunit NuoH [Nitrososphaerota archaeon]
MTKTILTFRSFVRHIVWLVAWLLVIVAVASVPAYFILDAFGINLLTLISMVLANPQVLPNFMISLTQTQPTESLFLFTTFPGFTFAALFSSILMIWVERKFVAKIQLRVGPQYAGKYGGILQNFADLFKLLFKEIIIPDKADKKVFIAVPLALMFVAGSLLALVPAAPDFYIANPSVGVIFVFALIGLSPIIALLAGWASNSKYSFLGGLRALHQMVAYEIPMILSVLGVVVLSGSLSLVSIVEAQSGIWFILLQPIGAIVFFVALLAELERIPFDLPEADSELVAGWQTEYSGMTFGIFTLATYIKFYALSGVFTVFFLGGWFGPSPVPPEVWFVLKTFLVMLVMMLPRAVMPRVRIDTLLRGGWTKLMVLTFVNLFLALLIVSLGLYHAGGL